MIEQLASSAAGPSVAQLKAALAAAKVKGKLDTGMSGLDGDTPVAVFTLFEETGGLSGHDFSKVVADKAHGVVAVRRGDRFVVLTPYDGRTDYRAVLDAIVP